MYKVKILLRSREVINKNLWLRTKIFYNMFLIILFVPEIILLYLLFIRRSFKNTPHVKSVKFNLINRLIIDAAVMRYHINNSNNNILNDEGIVGKLVSLSIISKISSTKIKLLIKKLLPKNSILIYVKTDPIKALKRENKRNINLPFFDDMKYELKKKFFYEAVTIYDEIEKVKNLKSDLKKISIYNQGNCNELIDKIKILAKKIYDIKFREHNGD